MNSLSPSTLSAVAGITALVGAFKGLTSSLKGVLDNYAHFEKLEMGLTTFFQDADKGKAKFEELRKLSNETTFGVDELTDSFTQLANVGVNVDSIQNKLTMLGDLAQGDKAKFAELTSIYAKINSTGKAGAMQLQQIASRGIPIYDMLKKIGVQGTATADDITQAFQEMTKEGGQFYNAMNNINETIEGKEGFISDYFKEFTVNFAEVTGLADGYKSILDGLKEAIGTVSDLLLKWNENPVIKAIMTGALSAILIGLVAIIGVSLVTALNTIIVKLGIIATLKSIISGPTGLIALGIAGFVGLAGALESLGKSQDEAIEKQKKLNAEMEKSKNFGNGFNPERDSRNNQLAQAEKDLETYNKTLANAKTNLEKAKKEQRDYNNFLKQLEGNGVSLFSLTTGYDKDSGRALSDVMRDNAYGYYISEEINKKQYEELMNLIDTYKDVLVENNGDIQATMEENIQKWTKSVQTANNFIDDTKTKIKGLKDEINSFGDTDKLKAVFEEVYGEVSKSSNQRKDLEDKLKQIQMYKAQGGKFNNAGQLIVFDNDTKIAIDETIRYLENKLKGVNAWEDIFESVTGIAVPKTGSNGKSRGQIAGEDYQNRMDKLFEAQIKAKSLLGGDEKEVRQSVASEFVKNIEKQIESLISNIDVDQPFEETDATIKALNQSLAKYKEMIDKTTESTGNFFIKLQKEVDEIVLNAQNGRKLTAGEYGKYAGAQALSSASTVGGDAGTFLQTFQQTGNVFLALINTIIGALVNVLQEVDGFEETLSPITNLFRQLKPSLEMIVEEVQYAEDTMNTVLKPLMGILNIIFKVLKPISEVLNAIIRVLFTAFGLFDSLSNWLEELGFLTKEETKSKEEELARQKALTDAYSNMLTTLREVQEEYEKRKKYINAQGYADNVTGVHDMILTPQGRFSTDPDDYIIATKNPSGLNGGKGDIIINNYSNAQVEAKQDDMGNTVILISQKVAMDYAQGNNGWENAIQARQARVAGRNLAM